MAQDLMRFSVAMPESLLVRFDALGRATRPGEKPQRGHSRPGARRAHRRRMLHARRRGHGTLTIVFNHHTGDVRDKLDGIQHEFFEQIVSSMHVHLDAETCMEVIILRGESGLIQTISNIILGTKGVTHGPSHHDLDGTWHLRQSAHAGHRRRECCARLRARPSAYPRP